MTRYVRACSQQRDEQSELTDAGRPKEYKTMRLASVTASRRSCAELGEALLHPAEYARVLIADEEQVVGETREDPGQVRNGAADCPCRLAVELSMYVLIHRRLRRVVAPPLGKLAEEGVVGVLRAGRLGLWRASVQSL